jgi:hypothetical protein
MFSANTLQSSVNAERAIQFAVATTSSICNGISVQNHGIGNAIAESNNDTCMIDHILIEYYSYFVIFYYKVKQCEYKNLLLPHS